MSDLLLLPAEEALYRRFGFVAAYDYWYRGFDV
jgi:predicted acetyltransferase